MLDIFTLNLSTQIYSDDIVYKSGIDYEAQRDNRAEIVSLLSYLDTRQVPARL